VEGADSGEFGWPKVKLSTIVELVDFKKIREVALRD